MLAPSPSSGRGEATLQPAYFTSSAFVHAARADVDRLVQAYAQEYDRSAPFARFRQLWQRQGWTWIQFSVFDARARAAFLRVMMRLFLERIGAGEPPLGRAAALFGLYTMYFTQPSTSAPSLHSVAQTQVTWDVYEEMLALPDVLDGEHLLPVRPHVIYVQSRLLQARMFHVLPHGEVHPLSPRALPREVVEDAAVATKQRGRPGRAARIARAQESLATLAEWSGEASGPRETRGRYAVARAAVLGALGGEARWTDGLVAANAAVVTRITEVNK